MKKILLIFLLFNLGFTSFSQQVKRGPEFVPEKKFELREIIGKDDSGYYFLESAAQGFSLVYSLSKFDKALKLVKTVPLNPKMEKEALSVEKVIFTGGKLYLFSSLTNKKNRKKILYQQTIDPQSLAINQDTKQLAEVEFQGFFKGGNILVDKSSDNSKILISAFPPRDDARPKTVEFMVLDQNMNPQWKNSVTFPKHLEFMYYNSRYVTRNGTIVIAPTILANTIQGTDFSMNAKNNTYKMVTITKEGISGEYDLGMDKLNGKYIQVDIADNGDILCSGLYRNDPKSVATDGAFFFRIDPATKKVTKSVKEFPVEFISKYLTKKREEELAKKDEKGKDLGLYDYNKTAMLVKKDGGCYYIAEQFDSDQSYGTQTIGNGKTISNGLVKYYYHNIIVISFNKEGVVEWFECIPKRQEAYDDLYSSFVPAIYNDQLYFLFNDHIENHDLWQTGKLKNFTFKEAGCVTLVSLDKTGKQSRKVLDKAAAPLFILPFYRKQFNDSELIYYSGRDENKWFSSVSFK